MEIQMRDYVAGEDFGEVYRLFTHPEVGPLILNKPDHNNMDSFRKWLDYHMDKDFHDFKVFWSQGNFLGFAYSYEFDGINGHCLYTIALKPEYQSSGVGGFVAFYFVDFLFRLYPLRKVYVHVYDRNTQSRDCVEAVGFVKEGQLLEWRYYDGRYDDLLIYGLTRDGFYAKMKMIFRKE